MGRGGGGGSIKTLTFSWKSHAFFFGIENLDYFFFLSSSL